MFKDPQEIVGGGQSYEVNFTCTIGFNTEVSVGVEDSFVKISLGNIT